MCRHTWCHVGCCRRIPSAEESFPNSVMQIERGWRCLSVCLLTSKPLLHSSSLHFCFRMDHHDWQRGPSRGHRRYEEEDEGEGKSWASALLRVTCVAVDLWYTHVIDSKVILCTTNVQLTRRALNLHESSHLRAEHQAVNPESTNISTSANCSVVSTNPDLPTAARASGVGADSVLKFNLSYWDYRTVSLLLVHRILKHDLEIRRVSFIYCFSVFIRTSAMMSGLYLCVCVQICYTLCST